MTGEAGTGCGSALLSEHYISAPRAVVKQARGISAGAKSLGSPFASDLNPMRYKPTGALRIGLLSAGA